MLQVNQTYIIARSGQSWYRSNLSFTNSFPYKHECLPKLIKGTFIKYVELHLRARDEPPSVTLQLLTKSNNEQKLVL